MAAKAAAAELLEIDGREVRVTNPHKVYFPAAGVTKLDLVGYYLAVADGALRAIGRRPLVLKRYVNGIEGEGFYQKRAPAKRPDWVRTVELAFPSGRTAHELVISERAQLVWITNLGNIDLHPHPVREDDLDHPDELRVDLDPGPGVAWQTVREVAQIVREVLAEHGLTGWPKTTGSRGLHVYVRLHREWGFGEVRRAALAVSREVERRAPGRATSKWWKEERVGVFLDYNQNAKDRTVAAAYSVRPLPEARVSAPVTWDEVPRVRAGRFHDPHDAGTPGRARRPRGRPGRHARQPGRVAGAGQAPPGGGARRRRTVAAALPAPARRTAAGSAIARRGSGCRRRGLRVRRGWRCRWRTGRRFRVTGAGVAASRVRRHIRSRHRCPVQPRRAADRAKAVEDAVDRGRQGAYRSGGARRSGSLEAAPPRSGQAPAGSRRADRRHARAFLHLDAHSRQPPQRARGRTPTRRDSRPDYDPWRDRE